MKITVWKICYKFGENQKRWEISFQYSRDFFTRDSGRKYMKKYALNIGTYPKYRLIKFTGES